MARTSTELRRNYIAQYKKEYGDFQRRAYIAECAVKDALQIPLLDIHAVFARPKHPESLRLKLVEKNYSDPATELTDRIGVRVITYYATDVDKVVEELKQRFQVDQRRSVDKRQELGLRDFGYRSVHLIVRLKTTNMSNRELANEWFEIQVRSVLEHAWAEIEHEVVYKSKIRYPDPVKRNFAMLAGVLELMDRQFEMLRSERLRLVESHRLAYLNRKDGSEPLDAARLMAFFECDFPDGLSWRKAAASGTPFPARIEARCLEALRLVSVDTATKLRAVTRSVTFKNVVREFASREGVAENEVSHLALAVIAIACKDESLAEEFFPDIIASTAFAESAPLFRRRAPARARSTRRVRR